MFFKIAKFFLFASVFAVTIVTVGTLFPFIVGKYVFFRLCVYLALIFFVLGLAMDPKAGEYLSRLRQIFRSPLAWAVSAYVFIFIIAGFTGLRPAFSFWSNFERGEGGFQMLTLYIFFVLLATLLKEERDWRKLFWCSVIAAGLMVAYGIGAGLKYIDADIVNVNSAGSQMLKGTGGPLYNLFHKFVGPHFGDRFQGSVGNPAYVAAYLIFILFYLAVLFVRSAAWRFRERVFGYSLIAITLGVVFYFSGTRGAFLGVLAGITAGAFIFGISEKRFRKWAIGLALGIVIIASLLVGFRHTSLVSHLPGARIFDISLSNVVSSGSEGTFSTRTIMWGIAWDAWKHHPLLGYGAENFIWVFDRFFNPRYFVPSQGFGAWFDRAHSIIFDNLVAAGALGLLAFLSIFVVLAFFVFKKTPRPADASDSTWRSAAMKAGVAGVSVAYLVQGLILFDVLATYINLFILFAFALYLFMPEPASAAQHDKRSYLPGSAIYMTALIGSILALLAIYFGAILPYVKASRYIAAETTANSISDERDFENHFNYALQFYSPIGGEELPKYLSSDITSLLPRLASPDSEPVARALVNYIEPYLWQNDVRHLIVIAQMHYILLRNFHRVEDFKAVETAFNQAHEIGPKLPQPLFGLYQLYTDAKQTAAADTEKAEILKLWPDAFATSTAK